MSNLVYDKLVIEPPYLVRKYGVTEAEFDKITDEDLKAELFDGVLIMHSPASISHEDIFMFLSFLMRGYSETKRLGKVLGSRAVMRLSAGRKFEPDLIFISQKRLSQLQQMQLEGAADLVVEILSESTRNYDLNEKRLAYQEAKIAEIWFVDPDRRQLIVDKLKDKGYVSETTNRGAANSEVLSGFWLKAEWLWSQNLPEAMPCLQEILKSL